ncbi:MAG: adaptor protein MecA [Bacillota bacterium]|nr:adaptor protein MecA [Bacillota bacterium]
MTIERIDEKRLLIALCDEDMRAFSLEFSTMGFNDPDSRKVLRRLLLLAGARTGVSVSNKSLLVEALPHQNGCLLLVTLNEKSDIRKIYKIKKHIDTSVFVFSSLDNFLDANRHLYELGYVFIDSSAYEYMEKYYLLIKPQGVLQHKAENVLKEYGANVKENQMFFARLKEYGHTIALHGAIWQIGSAMCKS